MLRGDDLIEHLDATLDLGLATTLAGLSLVAFVFLSGRVQQIEVEAGTIRVKRGGADAYASSLASEAKRLRLTARLVVLAAAACFASAILMLGFFDTFGEVDLRQPDAADGDRAVAVLDVVLTGITFLFGLVALLAATLAFGWEWLSGKR